MRQKPSFKMMTQKHETDIISIHSL